MIQKGTCIFCQKRANSKEHIWPQWVGKQIGSVSPYALHQASLSKWDEMAKKLVVDEQTYRQKISNGDPHSQRIRVVCKSCNNGWMSRLQNRSKKIMLPLISGHWSSLDASMLKTISAWAAMFTMVVEFKDRPTAVISLADRELLSEKGTVPNGWYISIAKILGEKWRGVFNHVCGYIGNKDIYKDGTLEIDPEKITPSMNNAQFTTFAVGGILFHTFSCKNYEICGDSWNTYHAFASRFGLTVISGKDAVNQLSAPNEINDRDAAILSNSLPINNNSFLVYNNCHLRSPI